MMVPFLYACRRRMIRPSLPIALCWAWASVLGCGETDGGTAAARYAPEPASDGGGGRQEPTLHGCAEDPDCPSGLICVATQCVSPDDLLPPDPETGRVAQRPAASAQYLFALSADTDSVAVIDAVDLSIRAVPVAEHPVAIDVLPGRDVAIVLSREGRAVSAIVAEPSQVTLHVARLPRRFTALSVSPDGRFAVAWTRDGDIPDAGAEGLVAIVDLAALEAGTAEPVELAAGYRHAELVFRTPQGSGQTTHAVVIGKDEATFIDLVRATGADAGTYLPERRRLPDAYSDVAGREVVATPDGRFVLMRSFAFAGVAALDVDAGAVTTIALPALTTDLDLVSTGTLAIAAIRSTSQVALLPLPESIASTTAVRLLDLAGVSAGQVEVAPDGRRAAVFSALDESERFAWLDLDTGSAQIFDRLRKRIRGVGLSPDGRTAVVIHRPTPDSTVADPYERAVDQDEGYSIVDLSNGSAQLKRTDGVPPADLVFTSTGRHAAVTLRRDDRAVFRIESANLSTLVIESHALASAPQYAGALPGRASTSSERVWATQVHYAGRISFLDAETGRVRTATGYHLNAGIE